MKKIITLFTIIVCFTSAKSFAQTTLSVGDISIIGFNANAPDNFVFVSWVPLQNGTIIKFTDNGFLSTASATAASNGRGGENFVLWQNNTGNTIAAGTVIKIEGITTTLGTAIAGSAGGLNGLSSSGDQIFAYQGTATTGANPDWTTNANPTSFTGTILYGLHFQGSGTIATWLSTGTASANTSYLPSELNVTNANIALGSTASRGEYTGSRGNQANLADYKALVNNTANWTTASGTGILSLNTTNFTVSGSNPSVNLSVSTNIGTESAVTVITVTATASAPVVGNQTVNLAVTGTNITAGDYTLSNTAITIPNGSTTGTVSFTVVDDAVVESLETAVLTISSPSAGIVLGTTITQNIDITDNDTPLNTVNLSVSTNTGSEENTTLIVVTATASAIVTGNQTVTINVSGTGITATDYILSGTTITIPNGQTTGSVNFIIRNDAIIEGTENALLTISSPSSGIVSGTTTTQSIAITDNTCQPLIHKSTATSVNGAEISAFDPVSKRIYTVAGPVMEYYTLSSTGTLSGATNLPVGFTAVPGISILPNSVAIKNGIVAVAYALVDAALAQQTGVVGFYNAATGAFLNSVTVGYLPDMLIFTPDGNKVLTANEGEPNSYGQGNSFDPEGSVSVIDIAGGVATATVQTVGFTSFNSQMATLKAAGVRIYGPGATVAQDLEPEYISFSGDGTKAFITLQENNAVAELDMATATITQILPLGLKNHNLAGNGLDASDRDQEPAFTTGKVNIQNWPIYGMYMPDAISSFTISGTTYYITANEGDSRAYTGYSEEIRVGAGGYVLDPVVFPNASTLKLNQNLGRLQLSNASGNTDADAEFEQIHALGTRSFSIWNSSFGQVFDSGNQLEQITATQNPSRFNADNSDNLPASFDTRSDNKGPEPEAVTTGMVNGVLYAFVGSERSGDIFVYDISNPAAPVFKQYIDNVLDFGVEGLAFVPANESPTGKALVISSSEISKTVSVYEFSLVTGTLATTTTTITANQGTTTSYGNCISIVATVAQNGANPVTGTVDAKVWIEAIQPATFVKRHYEITPSTNVSTATGKVTLYFTQAEFDDFNVVNSIDLPNNSGDITGIANLIVEKFAGSSNNGTGLPNSYSGSGVNIDPVDADIVWNSADNRWEVSVDITGFSGFFVKTISGTLPVQLVNFSGVKQANYNQLQWEVANELRTKQYELESSVNGTSFTKIGTIVAANNNLYSYKDYTTYGNTVFYRLKIVDNNGSFMYSNIVKLTNDKIVVSVVYPNPTKNSAVLQINDASLILTNANLYDAKGVILKSIRITANQQLIDLSNYSKGIYTLKLSNGKVIKIIKE
jgi:uncharacterized protein